MKHKKVMPKMICIFVILILVWTTIFLVDYFRVKSGSNPIFVIPKGTFSDGGSFMGNGFGYKVFVYKELYGEIIGYEMIPFWKEFDMEKFDREKKEYEKNYPLFEEPYDTDIKNNTQNGNIYTWEDIINSNN